MFKLAWRYKYTEQALRFFNLSLEDDINEYRLIYLITDFNARLDQYVEARRLFSLTNYWKESFV